MRWLYHLEHITFFNFRIIVLEGFLVLIFWLANFSFFVMSFLTFLQGYENKVVELQLVGYRLRALQQWRYKFVL